MSADGDEVGNVSNAEEGDATSEVVSTEDAKKVVSSAEEGDATSEFVSTEVATGAHAKKVVRAFVASVDLAGNTLCRIPQDTIDRWYWDWQKKQKTQSVSSRVLRQTFAILGGKKTRPRKRPLEDKDQRIVAWCLRCKHASVWRAQPDSDTEECQSTDDTEDAQRKDRESEGQNETEPHTPAARNTLCPDDCAHISKTSYNRLRKSLYRLRSRVGKKRAAPIRRRRNNAHGGVAVGIMNALRSHGMGADTTGELVTDILRSVAGRCRRVSKNTVKRYDAFASRHLRNKILRHAATTTQNCSLAQDTSSGARTLCGTKFSAVSVSFPHPETPERVLQVVADARPSLGGSAASKVPQLSDVTSLVRDLGFDDPSVLITDHEAAAKHLAELSGLTWAGCISHKMMHTTQAACSVLLDDKFKNNLDVFHRSCSSATVSTTSSGPRLQTGLKATDGGGPPAAMRVARQTGTRYCWELLACSQILHRRDMLLNAVRVGSLQIPGSSALQRLKQNDTPGLLDPEQLPTLCAATICYSFFVSTLGMLKGALRGKKYRGEFSASVARDHFPQVRSRLEGLAKVRKRLPNWIPRNVHGVEAAEQLWTAEAGTLLRACAREMLKKFVHFCQHDPDYDSKERVQLASTPATNDFTEGFHGTSSHLSGLLPHSHPHRLSALAMHRHNSGLARRLFDDIFPSDRDLDETEIQPLPPDQEIQHELYEAQSRAHIHSGLEKKRRSELVTMADDMGVTHRGVTVPVLRKNLADAIFCRDYEVEPTPKRPRRTQ